MHSAIIQVEISDDLTGRQDVATFYAGIQQVEKNQGAKKLGDFVWEINFQKAPEALAQIIFTCQRQNLPYRILPLDTAPQWIEKPAATRLG